MTSKIKSPEKKPKKICRRDEPEKFWGKSRWGVTYRFVYKLQKGGPPTLLLYDYKLKFNLLNDKDYRVKELIPAILAYFFSQKCKG